LEFILSHALNLLVSLQRAMDSKDKTQLIQHLSTLTEDLSPVELFPLLTQEQILTESDVQLISAEVTRRQQAYLLLTTLLRKGPKAYAVFLEALKDSHPHVHAMLLCSEQSSNVSGQCSLHIPICFYKIFSIDVSVQPK
jgi:CASP2 and RIPK1 domain-containing adaptor